MSGRVSFALAVILLLIAGFLRLVNLTTLPPGLHDGEIIDVRIAEAVREGSIEVFYEVGGEGREGFYHVVLAFVTTLIGNGPLGYRMLSIWTNMTALALVYALGRRLFGELAGLSAMSLLAVSLWPVLLSRQIGREALIPLLIVAILACLALALPVYRRRRKRGDMTSAAAVLGVLLGVSPYLHPIGLLTVLFSMFFIAFMLISRRQMSRRRLSYISFALLLMIIISMPYMISSIRKPQLGGVERLTGENYPSISLTTVVDALAGVAISGDQNPLHNLPQRPMFDPVAGVLILVGLVVIVSSWRHPRHALPLTAFVVLCPVFLLPAYAPDFLNYASALPLLALFFGVGVRTVANTIGRYRRWIVGISIAVWLTFNIVWTASDLFDNWAEAPAVQQAFNGRFGLLAQYLDRTADEIPSVLCGWRIEQSPTSLSLTDAQKIDLMMNRRNAPLRQADCNHALVMTNGGAYQQIILPDSTTLQSARPQIVEWLAHGELLNGEDIPPDTILAFDVEATLADAAGRLISQPSVSFAPEAGGSRSELVSTPISFGGNLTFLGYIPDSTSVYEPGGSVFVVTYWRVDGVVPPDLRLFTHILADPGARPPANRDIIYVDPSHLQNRDVFVQVTRVPLPPSLPDGEYMISIGAYQNTSQERLYVLDAGTQRGTRLFLYPIRVEAG